MMSITRAGARSLCAISCVALLLSGCGGDSAAPSSPTPRPTVGAPASDAAATGDATTLGALADRIAVAWVPDTPIVWSRTTSGDAYAAADSAADAVIPGFSFINEIDAEGDRRMTILSGQVIAGELVVVDGEVWAWGLMPLPAAAISAPDAAGWVAVTPAAALADAQGGQLVTTLLAPLSPVYAGITPAQRALTAVPIGPQPFGPRSCEAWRVEETLEGVAVVTIIGLDGDSLPCGTAITANGETALTLWTFGGTLDITSPTGTPVPPSA